MTTLKKIHSNVSIHMFHNTFFKETYICFITHFLKKPYVSQHVRGHYIRYIMLVLLL